MIVRRTFQAAGYALLSTINSQSVSSLRLVAGRVDNLILSLQFLNSSDNMSNRSTLSTSEDEYVRLKLELAAKRASVDTVRLQARQLISKRDGVSRFF